MTEIHAKWLLFTQGNYDWAQLFKDLHFLALAYLRRYSTDAEEIHDFFFEHLERIHRLACRYREKGKDFRNFLYQTMDWYWYSWKKALERKKSRETLAELAGQACHDPEPGYTDHITLPPLPASITTPAFSFHDLDPRGKKILLITLRNCFTLGDDDLALVAAEIKAPCAWVQAHVDTLRQQYADVYHRRSLERSRILAHRLQRPGRDFLTAVPKVRVFPRHVCISKTLEISKTTVDGILYRCQCLERQGKTL